MVTGVSSGGEMILLFCFLFSSESNVCLRCVKLCFGFSVKSSDDNLCVPHLNMSCSVSLFTVTDLFGLCASSIFYDRSE